MSLSVGIVGLPNAGKSTLFNALVARQLAVTAAHPFTTIEPNTGVVPIPDAKLEKLSALLHPGKTTSASITFVDIAGLVAGAHQGEGLGNAFLSHIFGVDAICHVLRAFEDPNVTHVEGELDPMRDLETVKTELKLKDLEILGRLKEAKKQDQNLISTIQKYEEAMNRGEAIASVHLTYEEEEASQSISLLSAKPYFAVLNVSEDQLTKESEKVKTWKQAVGDVAVVSAKVEQELTDLPETERLEYRQMVGISEALLDRIIGTAYRILNLITFYTVKGADTGGELRAWALPEGSTAVEAAGRVHSDFAKGFISAEVIGVDELIALGGWRQAKEKGKVRTEGKEYQMQDGNIVEFKIGR
jgi:GTP-binding protein YchF